MIVPFMPKYILNVLLIALISLMLGSCSINSQSSGSSMNLGAYESGASRAAITDDAFWQGSPNAIWDRLQYIPPSKLEAATNTPDVNRAGWMKLAIISKRYGNDIHQLVPQLIGWRGQYTNHPGNDLFPSNSTLTNLANTPPARHIALLLPLQGAMAANGQAVRNGFLSAYYESLAKTHVQQTISFYDTSTNPNIGALYQQAISQGADMVVGPLIKENVEALVSAGGISVPTLALNYSDNGSLPSNLYEFGLSQYDEIQQVAAKAWQSGRSHAIVIAPDNAWGQNASKKLISHWEALGGKVSDTLYFSPQTDFNTAIANLLHVNPVQDRNNKHAAQQRRQDFDVIFLLSEPQTARQIVPLLRFNYAQNIPIYSTSVIYSGSPNPATDNDLNGVIFADIPWLIKSSHSSSRLYAVGRDAYIISNGLQRLTVLPNFPLYAATGALTLNSNHQIFRRLPWTQIHNGQP